MKECDVFIKPGKVYSEPIEYILKLISVNQKIKFNFLSSKAPGRLIFDDDDIENSIPIAVDFYDSLLTAKLYLYNHYFKNECIIKTVNGEPDYLASAFYMVNGFQEYDANPEMLDSFGRFKFNKSYQYHYNNIEENLVQSVIENFCKKYINDYTVRLSKTRIFVSHDIDTINGELLQDGYWALRHKRLDIILKLIFNAFLLKKDWKNMDKIMRINDEYSIKSTFFWIATRQQGLHGIKNADYKISSVKHIMDRIENHGFFNGMHKSCSNISFSKEAALFPRKVNYNRNHFIHFKLPDHWNDLESSEMIMDFSLGFAESYGFRNSYGLPFQPYSLFNKSLSSFIEIPLHIMDATFHKYMKTERKKTSEIIIDFINKNPHNTILSLLWHNTYFTDYKYNGYLEEYKKVLGYIHDSKIDTITPPEILKEFSYGK